MENLERQPFIIAIDGYSSCGKSTLAKQLARHLNFIFVDSGAMYRAATLYFIENNVDLEDEIAIRKALVDIDITFRNLDGVNTTFLNGRNVENEIRSLDVSKKVSEVSAISAVRRKLVHLQRQISDCNGIVMDGRDIGTVVFPDADVKIFVTADPIVRAHRRFNELLQKDQKADIHDVITNLAHRDKIDTGREDSPLKQAEDAFLLDNTHLTRDEQFEIVLKKIYAKLNPYETDRVSKKLSD